MRKVFEIGGMVAAAILIAFGVVAIVMGVNGRSTVRDSLKQEQIVGSPDMTPAGIKAEATEGRPAGQHHLPDHSSPARRSTPAPARAHSPATCGFTRSRPPVA